jgi:hypothetical protein
MRYYAIQLTAPNAIAADTTVFQVGGGFVRYDKETTVALNNEIDFTTDTGEEFVLKPGQAAATEKPFRVLYLKNLAGLNTLQGRIAIAARGAIVTDSNIQGNVTATIPKPQNKKTVADVVLNGAAQTQILPADATRQQALISNLAGNASAIRVGDANTAAARGMQLGAGLTLAIAGTDAIFAWNPGAGQNVGVTTIND